MGPRHIAGSSRAFVGDGRRVAATCRPQLIGVTRVKLIANFCKWTELYSQYGTVFERKILYL